MLRQVLAPIHPDVWKFIAIAVVITVILFAIWAPVGWIGLILTLWIVYFFRDPWRVTPARSGLIVSPADGIIGSRGPRAAAPRRVGGVRRPGGWIFRAARPGPPAPRAREGGRAAAADRHLSQPVR